MIGTGLTMEGINQNYVVYDYMLQMGWRFEAPDLNNWYSRFPFQIHLHASSFVTLICLWIPGIIYILQYRSYMSVPGDWDFLIFPSISDSSSLVSDWNVRFNEYSTRRYGLSDSTLMTAWRFLQVFSASLGTGLHGAHGIDAISLFRDKPSPFYFPH